MITNQILSRMRTGEKAYGCTLEFPCAPIVELLGLAGLNYIMLDGEHGVFSLESVEQMCRAADVAGLTTIARVHEVSPSVILRFLDRGVLGIVGPHVSTRQQAQMLADACRFAPRGKRSYASTRGNAYGAPTPLREFMAHMNDQILVIAQLEDREALANLSEIIAVEGIDLFSYGPNDLALSMGFPGEPDHPQVQAAMQTAGERIHAAGKRLASDVLVAITVASLIVDGARAFRRHT